MLSKVIKTFNKLKQQGVIKNYAIGGGVGYLFYSEPTYTDDLDIFIEGYNKQSEIAEIRAVEKEARGLGLRMKDGYIGIDNIPVQVTIPKTELTEEALRHATYKQVGKLEVKVFSRTLDSNFPGNLEK